jgi:ABC-type nitrate/sulfonate/bicarbonate transport system permease component
VMVGIIIIASAGIAMTELLRLIERRFDRWRPSVGG